MRPGVKHNTATKSVKRPSSTRGLSGNSFRCGIALAALMVLQPAQFTLSRHDLRLCTEEFSPASRLAVVIPLEQAYTYEALTRKYPDTDPIRVDPGGIQCALVIVTNQKSRVFGITWYFQELAL
ncbi:hypothetical protein O9992_05810 [Vibrio lentus]|nr:hypothetical protein [Vibrio lentus]